MRAVEVLALNPEKKFLTTDLWNNVVPGNNKYSTYEMQNLLDFLEGIHAGEKPLVVISKPTELSKRKYVQWGGVKVLPYSETELFEKSNEAYTGTLMTIFKLSNGRVVAGRTGRMLHILAASSKENPVTQRMIDAVDLGGDDVPEGGLVLSALISNTAASLRLNSTDDQFVIHKVSHVAAEGERSVSAYWMERIEFCIANWSRRVLRGS